MAKSLQDNLFLDWLKSGLNVHTLPHQTTSNTKDTLTDSKGFIMNKIYTHPSQPQMQAEVILASKGPEQSPIYTVRLRYPRIIHGEIMTHRVFSRNARSSRAVPVKTMLNEVSNTPFVPWHWGKNQKGMQANEECNELVSMQAFLQSRLVHNKPSTIEVEWVEHSRESAWLHAKTSAYKVAKAMMEAGYHKQIPNRLLEPFSWIDTLITSTEWDNFLWLRDHRDAEPHLQDLARLVQTALESADIQDLEPGKWHLPYIKPEEDTFYVRKWLSENGGSGNRHETRLKRTNEVFLKLSAARCARISYKPFDGNASIERELERYDSLVTADRVHASPLEHQATPDKWIQVPSPNVIPSYWDRASLHGNLNGYIQYRKTVANEAKIKGVLS
jgi:hypothetical protein